MLKKWLIGEEINVSNKDKWIREQLSAIPKGAKILDSGAGEGKWRKSCAHLQYVSQDFCQYDAVKDTTLLKQDWNYNKIDIVSDITSIPVGDGEFDAVLCTEVLEHVPNPNKAVEELCRVLKPGGTIIITAPFCSLTHMAPFHFCTGFSKFWYENVLGDCGVDIKECISNGNYFDYIKQEVTRLPYASKQYTGSCSLFFKILCGLVAHVLLKKSLKASESSSELLCFGFFVKGIKKKV